MTTRTQAVGSKRLSDFGIGWNAGTFAAIGGLVALFLIPRSSRTFFKTRVAKGPIEPISPHSPFDIETPPAP